MSAWVLVPALVSLRNEINQLAPDRDRASDGSIGDVAHADGGNSDHLPDEDFPALEDKDSDRTNEVHAVDVDDDLRRAGWTMTRCVEIIVTRHREGRDNRLQNVIYNRRIWSRSWGWTARSYTGSNAHTQHAHFSARYDTAAERDTRPWGLLEADDMTPAEMRALLAEQIPALMTAWAESPEGRQVIASATWTADNVVSLDGPGGKPDAGGQSLVQWPRAGYAKAAADGVARNGQLLSSLGVAVGEVQKVLLDVHAATVTPPPPPVE